MSFIVYIIFYCNVIEFHVYFFVGMLEARFFIFASFYICCYHISMNFVNVFKMIIGV